MTDVAGPCYRETTNGVYFTKNAHRMDCTDPKCRGCKPCQGERHCTARPGCTWHVATGELTCGRCIAGVRGDLRWIESLSALLLTQALGDGVDSQAAMLAGPASDPEAAMWHRLASVDRLASLPIEEDQHPLTVLGTWDMMIRSDYDHPSDVPVTIANAAAYLDRHLAQIAHDENQDFPLLRRELRKCRQHLEAVIHNDDKPVRGVPCPECTNPETGVGPRLIRHYPHWCDDPECERIHDDSDQADVWRCPRNHDHSWTHADYEARVEPRRKATA